MLASKSPSSEKASNSRKADNKPPKGESAPGQLSRPLWNTMATHVQRTCTGCDGDTGSGVVSPLQTKLTVGAPGDPFEKEADAVADKAMRMPFSGGQEAHKEEVPSVQSKSNGTASQASVPSSVSNTIKSPGGGSPLNESVRSRVEPVLGADLSNVRVHSGSTAQEASHSLNAKAFTHQNNIFLGRGQSASDIQLMAHESAHVIQQGAGRVSAGSVQRTPEDIRRIIADGNAAAITALDSAEIARASLFQRAGMVRILTNLFWTREPEERATMRLIEQGGRSQGVLEQLDNIDYLDRVLASVDNAAMNARLRLLVNAYRSNPDTESSEPGDTSIDSALDSGQWRQVMRIASFASASNAQRLRAMQILLAMWSSGASEERKMIDILVSAAGGLRALMDSLRGLGLKESLFNHIDNDANKVRLTSLLQGLHDPELDADLAVFNQGVGERLLNAGSGAIDLAAGWYREHGVAGMLGSVISGIMQPIIHPIDTVVTLLLQIEAVLRTFAPGSLEWWTSLVTVLRDVAGTIGMWLLALSGLLGALALITSETVVGGLTFGAMAAIVFTWAGYMGLAFVGLAFIRLVLDLVGAGAATTHRQQERASERLTEDGVLAIVVGALALLVRGIKWGVKSLRGPAVDPAATRGEGVGEAVRSHGETASEGARGVGEATASDRGNVVPLHRGGAPAGGSGRGTSAGPEPMMRGTGTDGPAPQPRFRVLPETIPEPARPPGRVIPFPEPLTPPEPAAPPLPLETPGTQPNTGSGTAPVVAPHGVPRPELSPAEEKEEEDKPCGHHGNIPPSRVHFSPASGPRGGEVLAQPLSSRPGNTRGSAPNIGALWPDLWGCVTAAHGPYRWVHAHLLHGETSGTNGRHLHGPGNDKRNIILSDKRINGRMSRWVERPAISLVRDQGCILWYYVKVNHFSGSGALPYFAESVKMDYGYYYPRSGRRGPSLLGGGVTINRNPARTPPTCPQPGSTTDSDSDSGD